MTGYRVSAAIFLICCLVGCADNGGPLPGQPGDGLGNFEGEVVPASGSFVLKHIDIPTEDGVPIRIELIGRFVRTPDLPGQVTLAVSVRNLDRRTLHPPAEIVLSRFSPQTVYPVADNADWVVCPLDTSESTQVHSASCQYGFDYSQLLGDDGVLSPGETSGEKLWIFRNPDLVSFSFAARARFALDPDRARIAGVFFSDHNRNGVRDPDEGPFGGGVVHVSGPGIGTRRVEVGQDGHYSFHVEEPGLYNLFGVPPPTFAPVEFTTPNPLEVILLWASGGTPQSFLHADFGLANVIEGGFPPIRFTESTDGLTLDLYSLLEIGLSDHVLKMRVGFSGCSGDHPFQLYMFAGFMESHPVQARLLLDHDSRDEVCDAYFERDLGFDLRPILAAHERQYGRPGTVILRFEDWNGEVHTFELNP